MDKVVGRSHALLLARCQQLRRIAEQRRDVQEVLRLFFKMVIYDDDFDIALIESLKQAIGNFILQNQDLKLEEGRTIRKEIDHTHKMDVRKYVKKVVQGNEEDPDHIVFRIAPLVMRVPLNILEYPELVEDNKSPYHPFIGSPDENTEHEFQYTLDDILDLHNAIPISLLRSNKFDFDILYTEQEIIDVKPLYGYDSKIDTFPTSEVAQILEPLCCKRGYYLQGYYNTMMKKQGDIVQECVNPQCGGKLDKVSYEKLWRMKPGPSYSMIIGVGFTLLAYAVSMLFAIDHSFFY